MNGVSVIYIYALVVKKNFCYISMCVPTKKKSICIYIYVRKMRENDAHLLSVWACVFKNCLYLCVSVQKKILNTYTVNYDYFNEDIVCINPIDYANNHLFVFLLVTVKYTVKNRRILFLFSYCIYFTLYLSFPENLTSYSESVW